MVISGPAGDKGTQSLQSKPGTGSQEALIRAAFWPADGWDGTADARFLLSAGALAGCSQPLRVRVLGAPRACASRRPVNKPAQPASLASQPSLEQPVTPQGELEFGATAGSAAFVHSNNKA